MPRVKPQQGRTQEERSATTRAALLDATVDCLIEFGYAGTTTARVADRAGVSRGAHLHHFQTRATLVAAALAHLGSRREEEIRRDVPRLPEGAERVPRGLDLLWRWYSGPLFAAAVDLAAVARTDPELRASLQPVERDLGRTALLACREMFAGGRERSDLDPLIAMTLATVRGLALLPILQPPGSGVAAQWRHARERLVALFAAEGS